MIDRVKITLENFSGNFENCKNITPKEFIEYPDRKQYDNFVLRNKTKLDKHDLAISQSRKGIVTIKGSIRKWNFNNATLLDLTQTSLLARIYNPCLAFSVRNKFPLPLSLSETERGEREGGEKERGRRDGENARITP